jgi:hypothetical protein
LAWYLFLLAVAGGVVFSIWNYRRKAAASKAASEARFEQMFKGRAQIPASAQPSSPAAVPASGSADPAKAPAAIAATPPAPTQRFLGQAESLLYYLLKAGLPGFEVFAGVSLARVAGATGNGRDREQQARRLSQYQLDFVICDKSMRVVAVVDVESAAGAATAGDQSFKSDILRQAGIRVVRVNPAAPPRREQIRSLILGEPQQKDG